MTPFEREAQLFAYVCQSAEYGKEVRVNALKNG